MNQTVEFLRVARPYIRHYKNEIFVIKIGGAVLADTRATSELANQIGLLSDLGIKLVVIHGGGPQATDFGKRLGIEPKMIAGRRITDDETLDIVKMMYAGKMNVELVAELCKHDAPAIGMTGIDGDTIAAVRRPPVEMEDDTGETKVVDFENVGDIESINTDYIKCLLDAGKIPVMACVAADAEKAILNINGDSIAEAVAVAMGAMKLIFITSSQGLLLDVDDAESTIPFADKPEIEKLVKKGVCSSGMLPKVSACLSAASEGVNRTHIISGFVPGSLLTELFTGAGCGTMIVNEREKKIYQETEIA